MTPSPSARLTSALGIYEQPDDLGVSRATVTEDDRLEQRGPVEVVDVVDGDVGLEQPADDLDVAAVGGADQPGAVEAVEALDVGPVLEGQSEQLEVALRRRDEVRALDPSRPWR